MGSRDRRPTAIVWVFAEADKLTFRTGYGKGSQENIVTAEVQVDTVRRRVVPAVVPDRYPTRRSGGDHWVLRPMS